MHKVILTPNPLYKEYMDKIQNHINSGSDTFGNPIDVAKKIVSIAEAKQTTLRYPIGKGVRLMIVAKKFFRGDGGSFLF